MIQLDTGLDKLTMNRWKIQQSTGNGSKLSANSKTFVFVPISNLNMFVTKDGARFFPPADASYPDEQVKSQ